VLGAAPGCVSGLAQLTTCPFNDDTAQQVLQHVPTAAHAPRPQRRGPRHAKHGSAGTPCAHADRAAAFVSFTRSDQWTEQLASCLARVTALTSLEVGIAAATEFVPDIGSTELLAPALPRLSRLLRLSLEQALSGRQNGQDACALASHLAALTQLQHLELPLVDPDMYGIGPAGPVGGRAMQIALDRLTKLTHLDLSEAFDFSRTCCFSPEAAQPVMPALMEMVPCRWPPQHLRIWSSENATSRRELSQAWHRRW
jgi:hypothetical protein